MKTLSIIVNYHSAHLTISAVTSILQSQCLGTLQIVVAENSCDDAEENRLRQLLPREVILWVSPQNIGFGRACNEIFHKFDCDMILLLNPDARLLPGCLIRLQRSLMALHRAGAVGPQIYWDDNKRFHLPPSYLPELMWFQPLMNQYPFLHGVMSRIWRRFAIRVWQAETPIRVYNLSGGHVLLKRDAVAAVGGLFDTRYFLYYEDTDLFMRIRRTGYRLYVEPRAEVIHLYDQCGQQHLKNKRQMMADSRQIFMEKHTQGWKRTLWKQTKKCHGAAPVSDRVSSHFSRPFQIPVPGPFQKQWLFEWSPNADFIPAAGRFGTGNTMQFPMECWNLLAPGPYFARLGGIDRISRFPELFSLIKEADNAK